VGAIHPWSYLELREQGWKSFEELDPEDQAFFRRVLGDRLDELKKNKLLIRKLKKSTTRPMRRSGPTFGEKAGAR